MDIKKYNIETPIWKIRGFGLALEHMGEEGTLVTCSYTDKSGEKVFPGTYHVTREQMLSCPTMQTKGPTVYICPFDEAKKV
ncbi:MAG: hypothetical protein GY820_39065 [Gammaproteobacteria bacterium]|nr:hypothetical protein [Gammaproteobacteria bacterium]